jgi:hypothetical protein
MQQKTKYFIVGAAVVIAFISGRYTAPKTVTATSKTVQTDTKADNAVTQDVNHKKEVVTEVKKKDGTDTKVTVITDDNTYGKVDQSTEQSKTTQTQTTTIVTGGSKVTVSFMAGLNNGFTPVYGLSATKSILGPIAFGVWGLTSKAGGVSLGLQF